MKILLLCILLTLAAASELYQRTEHYDDQLVVKCELKESFKERLGTLLEKDFVDPWGFDEEKRLHIRLSVQLWSELQSTLPECSVVIENVENYVSEVEKENFDKSNPEPSWFEAYHRYDDIVAWYQRLARKYTGLVKYVESIGTSVEGRNIPAVHLNKNVSAVPNYTVFFQCQIHAREWVSAPVCMYIANYLCENYGRDERVTNLLEALQFVFIPVANPDGYEYTWTNDRLWRKNRRNNTGSSCMGVDLNRNFNDHWNQGGSSGNPCSEIFHGPSAASEPETRTTQAYFAAQNAVIAAVDWHSYSELILRPYGWSENPPPNERQLKAVGDNMSNIIYNVHGSEYVSEPASALYVASGGADDWFYGDEATSTNEGYRAASYTVELRDTGEYGFILPPDQIIPTGQEIVPAVLYLAETMLENPIHSSSG